MRGCIPNGAVTLNGVLTFSGFGDGLTLGPTGRLQNVSAALAGSLKLGQVAGAIAIDVPAYLVPTVGAFDRTIESWRMPLNGAADVAQAFGSGDLKTVRFAGGSLNLPTATVLKNLTIVVENGDVNFNGDRHLLENVRLIVLNGSVNLGDVQGQNLEVYAARSIHMNQAARFSGKNFLGTQNGDVIFNAAANTRGDFWSTEDFFANRESSIVGKIRSQQSITFNAHVNVIGEWEPNPNEKGLFTVDKTGQVKVDFLFDGSPRTGQLAIVNLTGMEGMEPGSRSFIQEAARRALSNSELGYIAIDDQNQGARFNGILGNSDKEKNNSGKYVGPTTFKMKPGEQFFVIVMPNGTVQDVYDNPSASGDKRPIFSLATANPENALHIAQQSDVVGNGTTFVMEESRLDMGSDRDYNDWIFRVEGATGTTALIDKVINPDNQ